MTELKKGLEIPNPKMESHILIGLHPDAKGITVNRDPFWISKTGNEVAKWFCDRKQVEPNHVHSSNPPCFTVKFDKNGTPFHSDIFKSDDQGYACSGGVKDDVVINQTKSRDEKIYDYHVHMDNQDPFDPGGGVTP